MHSRFTKVVVMVSMMILMVVGSVFANGAKEGPAVAERPKMRMWIDHPFYVKATEGLLKSYALEWAVQKGVDLEYSQDSDKIMFPRIDAAIESKTLPDVMLLNISWLPKLQRAGLVTDLTALAKELNANMGGFTKGVVAATTTPEGTFISIPFLSSSEEQYIRKDLLDAKGIAIPDTWEDTVKAARAVNNPPTVWGWGHQVAPYDGERHNSAMILAYGGAVWSKDGKSITLDSPQTRQVIALIKAAYDDGVLPKDVVTWDDAGNNTAYQSGKVAIVENTGSIATWMKANDLTEFNNTVFKAFPAGPAGRFIQADAWVLFVPNTTKYPDQAKDLIRALSQPDRQKELITEMGGFRVPVYVDLINLPVWKDRALKPLADAAPFLYYPGYPGPVTDLALEEFKQMVIAKMMVRVLSDKWTADQAIAEAVENIKRIQASLK
jgi:multiple sugar transport system substrate-binding protein